MNDSTSEHPQLKTCINPDCPCDNPQPIDNFRKSRKNGWRNKCRTCGNLESKAWRKAHPEEMQVNNKSWRERHPERVRELDRRWVSENRERKRELTRAYSRRNRVKRQKYHMEWYRRNGDRQRHKSKMWRLNNSHASKTSKQRYRARKYNLPDTLTISDWQYCLDYFNGCCAYCGNPPGLFEYAIIVVEHFIPLSDPDCPGTIPANIVPACKSCNSSKRDSSANEWTLLRFGKVKSIQILNRIQGYFQAIRDGKGSTPEPEST